MDSGVEALIKYKMFIGGKWVDSVSGETFESIIRIRLSLGR